MGVWGSLIIPHFGRPKRHSGIAGPWTCVLDSEMMDSGPIFPEISAQNTQKLLQTCIYFFVFLDRNVGPESSVFRVESPGPGSSDSRMPAQNPLIHNGNFFSSYSGWHLSRHVIKGVWPPSRKHIQSVFIPYLFDCPTNWSKLNPNCMLS